MEYDYYSNDKCFLEELVTVKEMDYYHQEFDSLLDHNVLIPSNSCYFEDYASFPINQPYHNFYTSHSPSQTLPFDYCSYSNNSIVEDGNVFGSQVFDIPCKDEPIPEIVPPIFNMGYCPENEKMKTHKAKKMNGQPSKNLMAERRRRKRLNDRLSMLRSVVPKISKMDRTSILGDTIEYMKELLQRVNSLQEEMIDEECNEFGGLMSLFKNAKPNEILVRNSPKFDVERINGDTRIKICCAMKPGLLLSTTNTLDELGLEIRNCVISCFNDFAMQASCSSQGTNAGEILESEDIKQALFRKAGYGGRCL